MEFSSDWKEDCKKWHGKELVGKKSHWCLEWDYLPIDETCHEFEVCQCDLLEDDTEDIPNES